MRGKGQGAVSEASGRGGRAGGGPGAGVEEGSDLAFIPMQGLVVLEAPEHQVCAVLDALGAE